MKNKFRIGIGVTGGIAGYKITGLITDLKKAGVECFVIMTESAVKIFGIEMFAESSGNPVYTKIIPDGFKYQEVLKDKRVEHISLADSLDLLLIAPATANVIAKISQGQADDYLTTLVLSVTCRVFVAPSMNTNMWKKAATRKNLLQLKNFGITVIPPDEGELACGYTGVGRLKRTSEIRDIILEALEKRRSLRGKKIIVTAGGTQSDIDVARVITNRASGKMGKFLAEEAFGRGAEVLLIRAENAVAADYPVKEITFRTADDLRELLTKYVASYDIILHSASVSDFNVGNKSEKKLDSGKSHMLELVPGGKLINGIKKLNPGITLIGFKAETGFKAEEVVGLGEKLISVSNADYVILNDIGRNDIGFSSDYNEVYIMGKGNKVKHLPKQSKRELAGEIFDYLDL